MRRVLVRTGRTILTIWLVMTLSFFLIRSLPGGPVQYFMQLYAQQGRDPAAAREIAQGMVNYNVDGPLLQQYIDYMISMVQGNMGETILYDRSVLEIILTGLPWTLFLMSISVILTFALGILSGSVMAYFEGGKIDQALTAVGLTLTAIPYYVVAILLVYFLGYLWNVFPSGGAMSPQVSPNLSVSFLIDVLYHAVLPITSFVITAMWTRALEMRGNSISVLGSDYMRVARLRGLSARTVSVHYVLRNAVLPLYTSFVITFGVMMGGSVILEQIFQYPGLGWYFFNAIEVRDFQLILGATLVITIAVSIGILIADLTYSRIDPTVEGISERETYGDFTLDPVVLFRRFRNWVKGFGTSSPQDSTHEGITQGENSVFGTTAITDNDMEISRLNLLLRDAKASLLVLWSDTRAKIGISLLLFWILLGTVGQIFIDPPTTYAYTPLTQPLQESGAPLGTNHVGQSLLSQITYAIPDMFKMIFAGAVFAVAVAVLFGSAAGYLGGVFDRITMTVTDILLTVPGLPLTIVLASFFQPESPYVLGLILSINNWSGLARGIRSQVLSLREKSHVEAMRTMGVSTPDIVYNDLLPNMMSYITINFASASRRIVFEAVALYYLGVLPQSQINWGIMLQEAYNNGALYGFETSYWVLTPMVAILLLVLGLVLLAQGADRMFNPRIRTRTISGGSRSAEDSGESQIVQPSDD